MFNSPIKKCNQYQLGNDIPNISKSLILNLLELYIHLTFVLIKNKLSENKNEEFISLNQKYGSLQIWTLFMASKDKALFEKNNFGNLAWIFRNLLKVFWGSYKIGYCYQLLWF